MGGYTDILLELSIMMAAKYFKYLKSIWNIMNFRKTKNGKIESVYTYNFTISVLFVD